MQTALLPVGYTLYIWGGGWNVCDTGAGEDAMRIGVSPRWKAFSAARMRHMMPGNIAMNGKMDWTVPDIWDGCCTMSCQDMECRETM